MSQAQLLPTEHFSPSVSLHDGRPATTSLEVAKFFSKRHDHVLRDIDTLLSQLPENSLQPNFGEMFQEQETPLGLKQIRIFILYRDGFMLLVMGYTGKKALAVKLAYIEAFNRLEAELAAQRGSALPSSDTLTPEQQAQLQAIVAAKAGMVPASHRRRAFQEIWARFNNNFQIARYAQLPPARIGEAVEYLVSMEVKAAKALPAAEPVPAPALPATDDIDGHFAAIREHIRQINNHEDAIFQAARKGMPPLRGTNFLALLIHRNMENAGWSLHYALKSLETSARIAVTAGQI